MESDDDDMYSTCSYHAPPPPPKRCFCEWCGAGYLQKPHYPSDLCPHCIHSGVMRLTDGRFYNLRTKRYIFN